MHLLYAFRHFALLRMTQLKKSLVHLSGFIATFAQKSQKYSTFASISLKIANFAHYYIYDIPQELHTHPFMRHLVGAPFRNPPSAR